ncbi:hypothetical protein [Catellatospora vulcania]|uniref:hypothetical protein n=1 Tax=Catellatospora vulcania TaxID=1460450 RepID=UPI001E5C666C|nr:hypothetical protein [Catellatospora vulcania]
MDSSNVGAETSGEAVAASSPPRRSTLRRRYLSLGIGELAAATVFVFLAVATIGPRLRDTGDRLALGSAFLPLIAILVQAGFYWLLARRWVGRADMPEPLAVLYRALRPLNLALLAAGLAGAVHWLPDGPIAVSLVAGAWLFGVVEYLNYFVVRLAYPPTRWLAEIGRWRTPRLMLDVGR